MISVYERIESLVKENKNVTFKQIGNRILTDWNIGVFKTQNEISEACFVSLATITQFAKACLCEGYKELIIRLKVEHENVMQNASKKNPIHLEDNSPMVRVIYDWVSQNNDFSKELASKIIKTKRVWICSSFQGMYSAKFLEDSLTNLGIQVKLIDLSIHLEIAKYIEFKKELIIFLLVGRDTNTALRTLEYLKQFENDLYLITTPSNIMESPELENLKHILVNFVDNNFFYKYRSYALITLFFSICEKVVV